MTQNKDTDETSDDQYESNSLYESEKTDSLCESNESDSSNK